MVERKLKPYLKNIANAIREHSVSYKNLLNFKTARNRNGYTAGVITFTDDSLTYVGNYNFMFDIDVNLFEIGETYVFSVESYTNSNGVAPTWYIVYEDGTQYGIAFNNPITITKKVSQFIIRVATGSVADNVSTLVINKPMLTKGQYPHQYTPYKGGNEIINAQDFPHKIADVYNKGAQSEYDAFWDEFQQNGELTFYGYAFAGYGWTKENFKPKYPIVTIAQPNRTNAMFNYSRITEIMIPLYFYDTTSNSTFASCTNLIKIGDDTGGGIWQTRNRTDSGNFSSCSKLEEIRYIDYNEKGEYIPAEIGKSHSFSPCKVLSMASCKNIISHLVDYSGTSEEGAYTITFNSAVKTQLQALEELAPSGSTWVDEISNRGWNLA